MRRGQVVPVTAAVLLTVLGGSVRAAEGPLEVRGHTSLASVAADPSLAARGWRPQAGREPRGSGLLRSWYRERPGDGRWRPLGAVRTESVLLIDPAVEGLRLGWWDERDAASQTQRLLFRVWRADELSHSVQLTLWIPDRGGVGRASLELGGERWVTTVEAWRAGSLPGAERTRLERAVIPELREALELTAVVATAVSELQQACDLLIQPLLGRGGQPCSVSPRAVSLFRGEADCAFDAVFGEPCPRPDLPLQRGGSRKSGP